MSNFKSRSIRVWEPILSRRNYTSILCTLAHWLRARVIDRFRSQVMTLELWTWVQIILFVFGVWTYGRSRGLDFGQCSCVSHSLRYSVYSSELRYHRIWLCLPRDLYDGVNLVGVCRSTR